MTTVMLVLLVLLPIGDALATAFFFSLFWRSKRPLPLKVPADKELAAKVARRPRLWGGPEILGGRSWLLGLMTAAWGTIAVVFVVIGYLAGRSLLGYPSLPEAALLVSLALVVLGSIPITFALAFYMTRRRRGGPPPFGELD